MRNRIFYFILPFLALMAPIIGNLNSVIDTLLSSASYMKSAGHLLAPLTALTVVFLLIGVLIAGLDFLETVKLKKIAFLKYFSIAVVIFLALDLSYGGRQIATSLIPFDVGIKALKIWRIVFALIALSIVYTLCWSLRDHLAIILISVFGVIFVSTIAMHIVTVNGNEDVKYADSIGRTDLPPVIHIIFDEMIGAEGIDRAIPGGEETYQLVRGFHDRFNFRLYGKAFSRHYSTAMSIPNLLNYDYTDETYGLNSKYVSQDKFKFFHDMRKRGYDVNVYQTTHVNFCTAGNIIQCQTLNSFNPASIFIAPPKELPSNALPVNAIVFSLFLQKAQGSYVARLGNKLIRKFDKDAFFAERYDLQSFRLWFEKFSNDVTITKGGEVFFAHFLIPHAPYLLNKNCDTKPLQRHDPYYLKESRNLDGEVFRTARRDYYTLYFEQVACVFKKLSAFMEKIENLEQFKNATIVIHGDHGSRISAGRFLENLSDRDFVDNYSTLFSVRSPGMKPGYDMRPVAIQRLFAGIFSDEFNKALINENDTVAVESQQTERVISAEMPGYGVPSLATRE